MIVLKRVPLNFDWPRRKEWENYFTPEGQPPSGAGYQIWDDRIPAPISPVVKTRHGIILWLREQGYSSKKAVQIVNAGENIPEN